MFQYKEKNEKEKMVKGTILKGVASLFSSLCKFRYYCQHCIANLIIE